MTPSIILALNHLGHRHRLSYFKVDTKFNPMDKAMNMSVKKGFSLSEYHHQRLALNAAHCFIIASIGIASTDTHAQQNFNTVPPSLDENDDRQGLTLSGFMGSRWRDNADLTFDNLNAEREDNIGANIAAFRRWRAVELSTDYSAQYLFIDSESPQPQSSRSEIRGITFLNVEPVRDRFDIDMYHARQNLLGRPGQLNLRDNFVARDIVSAQPNVYLMNSRKSQLILSALHSQVWFDQQNSSVNTIDSRLSGVQGSWTYALTPVSGFELEASDETITYQPSDGLEQDFDYRSVQGTYFSNLRQLKYRITGGVNAFRAPDGDVFSSPLFNAEVAYTQGTTTWRGTSSLLLTDTSRGNQANRSTGLTVGDGRSDFIDQYRLFTNELEVETAPCMRCSWDTSISSAYEVYNLNSTQDNYSLSLLSIFRYDLTTRFTLGGLILFRGQSFDDENPAPNFTSVNTGITGRYRLTDKLLINGILQRRSRRTGLADNEQEYDLNEASLTMTYQFR